MKKKNATIDEKVAFVAKVLAKEFKATLDSGYLNIIGNFSSITSSKFTGKTHTMFRYSSKGQHEVDFGEIDNESLGDITLKIADIICSKLKVKKSEILSKNIKDEKKYTGLYSNPRKYSVCLGIHLIKPCKGFFAINKKLKALGLSEINFKDWYCCEVSGKRSSIFSRDYYYYACSEEKCARVLNYLKGKKKLSYEFINFEDLSDRTRGETYETEWNGCMMKEIQFTDSKGHKMLID